ncbi:hypothetical protein GURASL_11410 [Geotalea uraniireducens]|uniref:Uncharacterized protein n=1 Tax=Geotalea uraniireducens TaxID=351604 RepID=A0ABM8EIF9_9BACT|nr:hypothetical protein GURASL_11410 [Geotalea uraniireducens]
MRPLPRKRGVPFGKGDFRPGKEIGGLRKGVSRHAAQARPAIDAAVTTETLLADYCSLLYRRFGTDEEAARRTQLDRRSAKKHVQAGLNRKATTPGSPQSRGSGE